MEKNIQKRNRLSVLEWLKRILKSGQCHGGLLRTLVLSAFIVLSFFNTYQIIFTGFDMARIISLVFPFILLGLIVFFINSDKLFSAIYIFIAIFTTINTPNISDFSGAFAFVIAFHLIRKNNYAIFIIISSFISLSLRLVNLDETIIRTMAMLTIFTFWYLTYYIVIYRNMPQPIKKKLKQLTKDQNKLLELMCSGYPQESAGKELGHKRKQDTSKMMKDIREALEVDDSESNYKVIALYLQYGK